MRAGDIAMTGWAFSDSLGRLSDAASFSFFCGAATTRATGSRMHAILTGSPSSAGRNCTYCTMARCPSLRRLSHSSTDLAVVDTDLLVVPWFDDETVGAIPGLNDASGGEVGRALESGEFGGKPYEMFFAPVSGGAWRAKRIALVGGGHKRLADGDLLRKIASAAGYTARQKRIARVAMVVRGVGDT